MDLIQPSKDQVPYGKWCLRICEVTRQVSLLPFKEMHPYSPRPTDILCPSSLARAHFSRNSLHKASPQVSPLPDFLWHCLPVLMIHLCILTIVCSFSNHLIYARLDIPIIL